MVGYVATGIIFAVLESPKSFTGTRHVRSCLCIFMLSLELFINFYDIFLSSRLRILDYNHVYYWEWLCEEQGLDAFRSCFKQQRIHVNRSTHRISVYVFPSGQE